MSAETVSHANHYKMKSYSTYTIYFEAPHSVCQVEHTNTEFSHKNSEVSDCQIKHQASKMAGVSSCHRPYLPLRLLCSQDTLV